MSQTRLQTLQELLAKNPDDAFVRYGIAQEYVKMGDLARAVGEFEDLRKRDPAYVATYYHLGQTYQKLGRVADARRTFQEGIEAATRKGDLHSRSELCDVLDALEG